MPDDLLTRAEKAARKFETKQGLGAPQRKPEVGFATGLLGSAASGAVELFGADPLPSAEAFQEQHPAVGGAAKFAGTLAPFLATGKARTSVPRFKDAVDTFQDKGASAFTQGAREGVATFAPLEGARLGGTALLNPEDLPDTGREAAVNLAIEAVGGGVLGGIRAGGKVLAPKQVEHTTLLNEANQLKLREVTEMIGAEGVGESKMLQLQREAVDLELKIKLEDVGQQAVKFKFADPEAGSAEVARLFRDNTSREGGIIRSKLARSEQGFKSKDEADRVLELSGLKGNLDSASLPRHLSFGSQQMASTVEADLVQRGRMVTVDDGLLMGRVEDGTFVMAKKISGTIGKKTKEDEWVLFRTGQPGKFAPAVSEFAQQINERMMMLRTEDKLVPTGSSMMDQANRLITATPVQSFTQASSELGQLARKGTAFAEKLGYQPGAVGSSFLVNRGSAFVEHYAKPALALFKKGPGADHAAYIWSNARANRDGGRLMANRLINGEAVSQAAKGFAKVFSDPAASGAIELGGKKLRSVVKILDSLDKKDIEKFPEVAELIAGGEDALGAIEALYRNGEISDALRKGLEDINTLDSFLVDEVRATQKAAGSIELNPMEGHLMLSRVWQGDFRAPIYNDAGELVYMASGNTPVIADEHAAAVIKESGLKRLRFEPAEKFDSRGDIEVSKFLKTNAEEYAVLARTNTNIVRNPQTFKERQGIGGFKTSFSRKELKDRITSHINERTDHMAALTTQTSLHSEFAALNDINPKMFATLSKKLEQLQEIPGAFSVAVNKTTDAFLKPVLGRNSATKISAGINEFFFTTQLGMGNLAFPVLNALTFTQTVFPEASYVLNASPSRLMKDYYEVVTLAGSDLKPRGHMHTLSTNKIMLKSMKAMRNVTDNPQLSGDIDRALSEGALDPKLFEEFIGKTSGQSATLGEVLKGEESMYNFMRSASGYLPSKSERFARGHSFVVGHLLAKDVLNLPPEAAYQFSKKFTERTMYNYGTADRATLMTGPVGKTFGLFKNWQTHYLFSMMQYAEEGVKYDNWAPLLWQMGGTGAIGGVSAMPLFGAVDAFSRMTTDESAMTNLYQAFGGTEPDGTQGTVSDAVFMGLPAFLGLSLSGNVSAPGSDPARDAAQLMSFPQMRRTALLGQAIGEAVDNYGATGQHPIASEGVRDKLTAALAPKVMARMMQMTNEAGLKSLTTGKTVLKDLNTAEKMMYGMGFTPRRVGVAYEAAGELWKDQKARSTATRAAGKAWFEAQAEQDWDTLKDIQERAMITGLDLSAIQRSADGFRSKFEGEAAQRQFTPEALAPFRELGIPGL